MDEIKIENTITEQEMQILLGEKDLAIFFLQKKIKLLTEELGKIKATLQEGKSAHSQK